MISTVQRKHSLFIHRVLLNYLEIDDPYEWKGILLACCMFTCNIFMAITNNHSVYTTWQIGIRVKSICNSIVYRKVGWFFRHSLLFHFCRWWWWWWFLFHLADIETGRGRNENNHCWGDRQSYGCGCSETTGHVCLVNIPVPGTLGFFNLFLSGKFRQKYWFLVVTNESNLPTYFIS